MCKSAWFGKKMGMHGPGCGCHECHMRDVKKKKLCAMVFFCGIAMISAMIAGILHLKLHRMG